MPRAPCWGGGETGLYAVVSNSFQALNSNLVVTYAGVIGTTSGLASMCTNPANSQVLVVDGARGYIYTPALGLTAAPTGSWFVPGAQTCTNVGGYFVTEIPNTNQFAVSNINDATSGSALSFGAASQYPDQTEAVDNLGGNLIVFCQQHTEFWQNVGGAAPSQPFAPIQSATNRWGLGATFSRANVDDSLIFLGETIQGVRRVVQIRGYAATPISDEIDWIINQDGFVFNDAVAMSWQKDKHSFYQITFPTMNRTFSYDCSTGIWSEMQTGVTSGYAQRHVGNLSAYFNGDTIVSDYSSPNLYRFSDQAYTDNGQVIPREVITRTAFRGGNRFRVPSLFLDMETGVGSAVAGNGAQATITIECSKDDGRTWLLPRTLTLGALGYFMTRVNARRWGRARRFTWRIRMTDPAKFVIGDAALRIKGVKETF